MMIWECSRVGVHVTVLTKGLLPKPGYHCMDEELFGYGHDWGITVVCLDEAFREQYEPCAAPIQERISSLSVLHEKGERTWASIEPLPPPEIWEVDVLDLLEAMGFADRFILGKWNYGVWDEEEKKFRPLKKKWNDWWKEQADRASEWCKTNNKGLMVKEIYGEPLTKVCDPEEVST